jgi:hypothetical protein
MAARLPHLIDHVLVGFLREVNSAFTTTGIQATSRKHTNGMEVSGRRLIRLRRGGRSS